MEKMTIELISLVEKDGQIRAWLHAHAEEIGVTARLTVTFDAPTGMGRKDCIEEAYDRALAVLDPA